MLDSSGSLKSKTLTSHEPIDTVASDQIGCTSIGSLVGLLYSSEILKLAGLM